MDCNGSPYRAFTRQRTPPDSAGAPLVCNPKAKNAKREKRLICDLNWKIHLGNTQPAKEAFLSADCKERVPRQTSKRISSLHMLLRLQNKEINYLEPRLDINAKKREAARPPPSPFSLTARCRPPVSGALASHGLTPQYSRRDGA